MGVPAAILSIASIGVSAIGTMQQASGTAAADTYRSEELQLVAQEGEAKATQTNAQLTSRLAQTLGNIDAVRAAARTDPTSPTGAAVRNEVEATSTNQKDIEVNSIMSQSAQDESSAAYLRTASSTALLSGGIGAGAGILKGIAGLPSIPGGLA